MTLGHRLEGESTARLLEALKNQTGPSQVRTSAMASSGAHPAFASMRNSRPASASWIASKRSEIGVQVSRPTFTLNDRNPWPTTTGEVCHVGRIAR